MANQGSEKANRAVKRERLVETIDSFCTRLGADVRSAAFADFLAGQDAAWWHGMALLATVNDPSETTRAEVIAIYRERPALDAAWARLSSSEKKLCQCGEVATKRAGKSGRPGSDLCRRCWGLDFGDPGEAVRQ